MGRIETKSAGIGSVLVDVTREIGERNLTVNTREEHVKQQVNVFNDPVMKDLIGDTLEAVS